MSTTTKTCGTCGLATPDGTCPDCLPTYHVEYSSRDGGYNVVEYRPSEDRFIVRARGLRAGEARRQASIFTQANDALNA